MSAANPEWPGILNFRDIGGVALPDGSASVRRGRIFRGAGLYNTSDEDLAKLKALGVGLVFDLRSRDEANGRPDRVPAGVRYRREPAVISMDEVHRESLNWDALIDHISGSDDESKAALAESESFHKAVYTEMIARPDAYRELLHEMVATPAIGVFYHCSAGKDRTGVASMIILTLLGVARDDVMADYLESSNHPLPEVAHVRQKAATHGKRVVDLVGVMMGVAPWQLDGAFDAVDQLWGGWDGFVRDGLGLTGQDVQALRDNYLS